MPPDHQLISGYQTTYGHRTCPFVTNSKCSLKRFLFEPEAHGAHERVHISSLCTLLHLLFVDRVDKKTFVNLIGAQLLGPALSAGAIYVASVLESSTDILCIKGNYCPSRYSTTVVTSVILGWIIVMLFVLHCTYFCCMFLLLSQSVL